VTGRGGPGTVPAGTLLATATAAASAGKVTAMINGVVRTIWSARDLTVASGDVILVVRFGATWLAIARFGTAAPAAADYTDNPPDPNPLVVQGTLAVLPTYTGTYRDSRWVTSSDQAIQGAHGGYGNATGAAFYGTKPLSLTGATVTGARVRLQRSSAGDQGPAAGTLRLVTEAIRPAGAPTLGASVALPPMVPGQVLDVPLTTSWVQSMVAGTAGGLAVFDADGSPWIPYTGRSAGGGFTLTIDWERA